MLPQSNYFISLILFAEGAAKNLEVKVRLNATALKAEYRTASSEVLSECDKLAQEARKPKPISIQRVRGEDSQIGERFNSCILIFTLQFILICFVKANNKMQIFTQKTTACSLYCPIGPLSVLYFLT